MLQCRQLRANMTKLVACSCNQRSQSNLKTRLRRFKNTQQQGARAPMVSLVLCPCCLAPRLVLREQFHGNYIPMSRRDCLRNGSSIHLKLKCDTMSTNRMYAARVSEPSSGAVATCDSFAITMRGIFNITVRY